MQADMVLDLGVLHLTGNRKLIERSLSKRLHSWPPTITPSPQQGHTHSSKVTPPNSATPYEIIGDSYIQTTTPDKSNFRKERFVLAHSCKQFVICHCDGSLRHLMTLHPQPGNRNKCSSQLVVSFLSNSSTLQPVQQYHPHELIYST